MSTGFKPPEIEGRKAAPNETEIRAERQEVLEQVGQMDLVKPESADAVPHSRDIVQPPQEKIVEKAEAAVEDKWIDKGQAKLENAKKAISETKRRRKATGKDAAAGTPAPLLLDEIAEKLRHWDSRMDQFMKMQDDFKTFLAHQAPLQAQQIVPHTPTVLREDPGLRSNYTARPTRDDRRSIPLASPHTYSGPVEQPDHDAQHFKRKFQKAFEQVDYYNDGVRSRGATDPTQGQHYGTSQTPSNSYLF